MGFIVFITFVIAVIALILAYKAFTRSGGSIDEMRADINDRLSPEKFRKMTADALTKMGKTVRGDETTQPDAEAPAEEEKNEQ